MTDIDLKIEVLLEQGDHPRRISEVLEVPLEWVLSMEQELLALVNEGRYDDVDDLIYG